MAQLLSGFVALAWLLRIGIATTHLQLQRLQPQLRDGYDASRKALLDGFLKATRLDYSSLRMAFAEVGVVMDSDFPYANVSLHLGQSRGPVPTRLEEYQQVRRSLSNDFDLFYIVPVQLGTPPVTVRMVVDTGSSDMWVRPGLYDSGDSSTAGDERYPAALQFGVGSVLGTEVSDKMCMGSVCVLGETLVAASLVLGIGNEAFFDGLLGLAFPALAKTKGKTFLTLLEEQRPYKHLAFGLSLHAYGEGGENFIAIGELQDVIGDAPYRTNSTASSGISLPVWSWGGQPRFWMVKATVLLHKSSQRMETLVALDSGTSLVAVPAGAYPVVIFNLFSQDQIKQCAPVNGQILCPCSVRMNPLTFSFHGDDGRALEVNLASEDLLQFVGVAIGPGIRVELCRLAIQASPPMLNFWILGDAFLRRVYTVHDVHDGRVLLFESDPRDRAATIAVAAPASESATNLDFGIGLLMPFVVVCAFILYTTIWALLHSCSRGRRQAQRQETDYMRI